MTDERQTPTATPPSTDSPAAGDDAAQSADTATAVAEAPPQDAASTEGEAQAAGGGDSGSTTAAAAAAKGDETAEETSEETGDAEPTPAKSEGDAGSDPAQAAGDGDSETETRKAEESEKAESSAGTADAEPADAKADAKDESPEDESAEAAEAAEAGDTTAESAEAAEATEAVKAEAETEPDTEAKAEAGATDDDEAKAKDEAKAGAEAKADETKDEKKEATDAPAKAETKAEAKSADDEEQKADAKGDEAKAKDEAKEAEKAELDDPTLRELRAAKEKGERVSGKVIGWNQGGFHVVIDEVTAFCPASEMELGRPRSPNTYVDREMDFKVVKFQRRGRRVVLSRSEVLAKERETILEELQPGKVVTGIVTSLPDFGAFVDLGGVEGLVHVSEISRSRVKHPRDVLEMGQQVEVKVLKVEEGGDRISLSMKELEPDPWNGVAERYPRGTQFTGKVLRKADFGLFVELEPDVEGLIHVSQLAPGQSLDSEDIQPGNTVEGWVRDVEPKRQRISLSLREVPTEDPWKTVSERFPEGEMVEGTVESIAPFGVFINLAPGLTGLLPNSQTGLPRGSNLSRAFHPGQTVQVAVLSIDTKRKRISLGKEGSRAEATKADLKAFKQEQKEREKEAPSAMAAALAGLKDQLDLSEGSDEG